MLLGFIAGILNKFIGAYFEDIDVSQLTGSIFGGGVTLNNINLRSNIFESLGIPFHVVAGKCGTLEVNFSLTKLYSEPVIVTLKDLHLLIIPAQGVEYNEEAEQEALQREKMRQLEVFESVKRHLIHSIQQKVKRNIPNDEQTNDDDDGTEEHLLSEIASNAVNMTKEATYFDMWIMQVLRNIQFRIESVHVRFEDDLTKPMEHFAVGLFLKSLKVTTTDANWESQYIKDYLPDTSYKLVAMNGLSVYWNPAPTVLYKGLGVKSTLFERLAHIPKRNDKSFNRLFEPLSTDLKVQVTPFPDVIPEPFSKPRLLIETSLNEFSVNISDKQVKDIIPFADSLELLIKSYKYRKFRAELHNLPYQGNYKKWWHFIRDCLLDDIRRRRNNFRWSHIREHRQKCKNYLTAYFKKKVGESTPEIEETILILERELELFVLIILRQQVDILLARHAWPNQQNNEGQDYMSWVISWFPSWFSYEYWFTPGTATGIPGTVETSVPPHPPPSSPRRNPVELKPVPSRPNFSVSELKPRDKEVIRVAVGFAKRIDIVNYPHDYVDLEANVLLNQFRARLFRLRGKPETVLDGILEKVSFILRSRPVDDGLQVELKIGRIEMYGGDFPKEVTTSDTYHPPPLITTANPNACEYYLKFLFEMNPIDSEVDHKVVLEGLALQFTYLEEEIDKIIECFSIPPRNDDEPHITRGSLRASQVLGKISQFRRSPTSRLLRMMESKGKVEIDICLIAPYLVIPQDSTIRGRSNFVVVNLGEINVVGTLVGGTLCENGACSHFI